MADKPATIETQIYQTGTPWYGVLAGRDEDGNGLWMTSDNPGFKEFMRNRPDLNSVIQLEQMPSRGETYKEYKPDANRS